MEITFPSRPWTTAAALMLAAVLFAGCGNPDRNSMKQAAEAYESGRYEKVIDHLQKVINRKREGVPLDRAYNLLGLSYWQIGNVDQAIEAFRMSKRANPDYFEASYNLGVMFCEQDEIDKGAVLLEEAALIDTNDTRALEFLAASFQDRGEIDKAHEKLKEALTRRKTPRILTALAITGHKKEGSTYAKTFLDQALAIDRHYPPALYTYGSISERENESEEAIRYFEKFLLSESGGSRANSVQQTLARIKKKTEKKAEPPDPVKPPLGAGPDKGDPPPPATDPVEEQIRSLLEMARSEVKAGAEQKALNLCLMAAQEAKRENKPAEQERALRTATSLCPHSSKAHFAYARFLNESGRSRDAVAAYQEAIKLRPNWSEALNGLAVAAIQDNNYQTARTALRDAVKADPENPDSLWALALFYDTQLQLADSARKSFQEFIRKFPSDPRIGDAKKRLDKLNQDDAGDRSGPGTSNPRLRHEIVSVALASDVERALAATPKPPPAPTTVEHQPSRPSPSLMARRQFNQGVDAEEAGDPTRALRLYQRASELDPDFAAPHYNRGIILHRQGDLASAGAAYQKALDLQPDLINARYHLGLVHHTRDELTKAETQLKKVLNADPNHGSSHYVLGMIYAKDPHRRSEARRHYVRFVDLSPEHPAVPGVRQWLISN